MSDFDAVASRLAAIRARVVAAAASAGRDESSVRIVAVTKRLDADAVRAAYAAGQRDFGENYVQEAVAKIAMLADEMPDARWHLVGRLQSNKAAVAVRSFSLLHGIDSSSTVAAIARAASQHARVADLLLQVRLVAANGATAPASDGSPAGQEGTTRAGVDPASAAAFLREACVHNGIRFVGLMGVADPDGDAHPQFAALRELSVQLAGLGLERVPLGELSMGMTGDFEDAVAEGATIVRIGTAIFGERPRG